MTLETIAFKNREDIFSKTDSRSIWHHMIWSQFNRNFGRFDQ